MFERAFNWSIRLGSRFLFSLAFVAASLAVARFIIIEVADYRQGSYNVAGYLLWSNLTIAALDIVDAASIPLALAIIVHYVERWHAREEARQLSN